MNKKLLMATEFVANEEIKNISSYKNTGVVKGVFYPKNEKELYNLYVFFENFRLPYKIIGNGSNLLISEKANTFFISTRKLKQKISLKNDVLSVSASVPLIRIYAYLYKAGYGGFEKICQIPASVGGAIKMNASSFGQSIFDNLESINIIKGGKKTTLKKEQIKYGYHYTNLDDCIIISAKFKLKRQKKCILKRNFENYSIKREISQPKGFCCGSVFKNPENLSAGKLIEDCGLKGLSYGDAQISKKHANFILNNGNATFREIEYLINFAQLCVLNKFGILLEKEVEIIK